MPAFDIPERAETGAIVRSFAQSYSANGVDLSNRIYWFYQRDQRHEVYTRPRRRSISSSWARGLRPPHWAGSADPEWRSVIAGRDGPLLNRPLTFRTDLPRPHLRVRKFGDHMVDPLAFALPVVPPRVHKRAIAMAADDQELSNHDIAMS